jgi:hypothetical protein
MTAHGWVKARVKVQPVLSPLLPTSLRQKQG